MIPFRLPAHLARRMFGPPVSTGAPRPKSCPPHRKPAYGRPFWLAYASNLLVVDRRLAVVSLPPTSSGSWAEPSFTWAGSWAWVMNRQPADAVGARIVQSTPTGRDVALGRARPCCLPPLASTHLAIALAHTGVAIYALRNPVFAARWPASHGARHLTFVSKRGSAERMAELIGMLGPPVS